ncbi:MAG TPA: hypothetical protein DIW47_10580 [Bacteroidetes bacterium]|nr:hypothetical protein [Bacteroidota bacterium]
MTFGTSSLVKLFLLAGLVSASISGSAQQITHDVPDSLIKKDSIHEIRLLIVPFNPSMYFSDADKDIAEVSKVEPGEVRNKVNASLEATVSSHLGLYYSAKSLSKQKDGGDDLDIIYGSITYAPRVKAPETGEKKKPGLQGLREKIKPAEEVPEKQADPETYMDISFADGRLMDYIGSKYEVDYVVFFNQFEIITDYENCIDLQLRKYYREIKVHYSVYGKDGKKISGDVITIPYHSNENDIQIIVKENFGTLSSTLLQRIYLKK